MRRDIHPPKRKALSTTRHLGKPCLPHSTFRFSLPLGLSRVACGAKILMSHEADVSEEADPSAPELELAAQGQISWHSGCPPRHGRSAAMGCCRHPWDTVLDRTSSREGQKGTPGGRKHLRFLWPSLKAPHALACLCQSVSRHFWDLKE